MKTTTMLGLQFQELNTQELQTIQGGDGIVKDVWEVLNEKLCK